MPLIPYHQPDQHILAAHSPHFSGGIDGAENAHAALGYRNINSFSSDALSKIMMNEQVDRLSQIHQQSNQNLI